jgi:hypothetical protein
MDSHDDWTDLLEKLKQFKGKFALNEQAQVRHKTQTTLVPDWLLHAYGSPDMACPLNSLCQASLSDRGESVPVLENGDFADMATILGIPQEYVERFACAADGDEVAPDDASLRQRIIETLC